MKKHLQYYFPITLTLFCCVTIDRNVTTDGGFTHLYGLPLPYISNAYASSFCYEIHVSNLILNLLFFYFLTWAIFKIIDRNIIQVKTNKILTALGSLIGFFWIFIYVINISESHFKWNNPHDYFLINYNFILGLRP